MFSHLAAIKTVVFLTLFGCLIQKTTCLADEPNDAYFANLQKQLEEADDAIKNNPESVNAWIHRGELHFQLAKIAESISDFDRAIELRPAVAPQLWQRGIALYYAEKYAEGQEQFELHQQVNPDDVENSVWHFLCVAKQFGTEEAKKRLISTRGDSRWPMMKILQMYRGELEPKSVLDSVTQSTDARKSSPTARMYAYLYVGLYFRTLDNEREARANLRLADAQETDGFMKNVSKVDLHLANDAKSLR